MKTVLTLLGAAAFIIASSTIMAVLTALPTMWVWNAVVPDLFGLPLVTFWQALGLCVLFRLLTGTGSSGD